MSKIPALKLSVLEQIRRSIGLTKKDFAKQLDINESTYCTYELGVRTPSAHAIYLIMRFLKSYKPPLSVTIEDVLMDYKKKIRIKK